MKRTTELNEVKDGARFTWGEVIAVHEVGPYSIVECHPWTTSGCALNTGEPNENEHSFHGYINQKSVGYAWDTLDAALAGCIAYRHEGPNSRAGEYFIKMISEAPKS